MDGFTDKHIAPAPWHAGERALQSSVGLGKEKMDRIGRAVFRDFMTEHRDFFAELPFVIVGSIDGGARPRPPCWRGRRASSPARIPTASTSRPTPSQAIRFWMR